MRKVLQPAFSPKAVASYVPDMVKIAEECCSRWAEQETISGYLAVKEYTFVVGPSGQLTSSYCPHAA